MTFAEQKMDETFSKIEKITNQLTDAYIQNSVSEMSALLERKKLTLWIVGLATALEVYLLNQYSWTDVKGFSAFLFVSSVVLFLLNSVGALYLNKMVTYMYVTGLKKQRDLNLQRVVILNAIDLDLPLKDKLLLDLNSKELPLKLIDLNYLEKKHKPNEWATRIANKLVDLSDGNASYLLILQLIISFILFLIS